MKKNPTKAVTPEELEKAFEALEKGLRYSGKLLPTDENLLDLSEENNALSTLPDSLKDAEKVLARGMELLEKGLNIHRDAYVDSDIECALAHAARNGTRISDEILKTMHADRDTAESAKKDHGKT